MILPLTINLSQDLDGSKDRPRISPSTDYYIYSGKKK